ncbi:hypothetical protein NUW54_g4271 [Trametes sanguinea]|uniref:Uncharacterized protein n=1 Tax=Trametes sanguinea TaxID=158606 RepID=A0ACC1Q099_9APHY|nr:hypothetical protein NUW54_g4271 [Trametes sanguinea]
MGAYNQLHLPEDDFACLSARPALSSPANAAISLGFFPSGPGPESPPTIVCKSTVYLDVHHLTVILTRTSLACGVSPAAPPKPSRPPPRSHSLSGCSTPRPANGRLTCRSAQSCRGPPRRVCCGPRAPLEPANRCVKEASKAGKPR